MNYDRGYILDLCSGTGSSTRPFVDAGYHVITVDMDHRRNATHRMSVQGFLMNWKEAGLLPTDKPCLYIHASPNCKLFSVSNGHAGKHWFRGYPASKQSLDALELVLCCLKIIEILEPKYWSLENPKGRLRSVPFMGVHPRRTVTYCQYQIDRPVTERRMKPTDIWGVLPVTWKPKRCSYGDDCHMSTPSGSHKGTDAESYDSKIEVPYELMNEIMKECRANDWSGSAWTTIDDFMAAE